MVMPMRLPSIGALRAFEAAARLLSFTQAAAELSLTQGAVSRRIHELESGLGERLFHREGKSLRLSEAGRAYLPFARDALERLRAGHEALARKHRPRILTVSVSPNFAARWLVPRLGRFLDAHPEVDLRVGAAQRHVDFASDDVDLAVRHGVGEWPGLHVMRLCEESVFPACSPGLLRGGPALREPHDLRRHVLLHDRDRFGWAQWLDAAGVHGVSPGHGPVFSHKSLALDAAAAGQGVALARTALAALDLIAGRLLCPLPERVPAPYAYWVVCPRPSARQPLVAGFRRWLLAQAGEDARALAQMRASGSPAPAGGAAAG
jgi:LysR family glycine cleavage system transcriptional activator